jgi:hypothetical protein
VSDRNSMPYRHPANTKQKRFLACATNDIFVKILIMSVKRFLPAVEMTAYRRVEGSEKSLWQKVYWVC